MGNRNLCTSLLKIQQINTKFIINNSLHNHFNGDELNNGYLDILIFTNDYVILIL